MAKAEKQKQVVSIAESLMAQSISVPAPNIKVVAFPLRGTAPFVQNKFSAKCLEQMRQKQEAGSTANKGKKRDAKDFKALYEQAMYLSTEGWRGIPAPAFRNAMISACRTVGFKMTLAKLSVFIVADGYDKDDGTPLVRIMEGEPEYHESMTRNATGVVDIRPRAMWRSWKATLRVRFDADQFTVGDLSNLLLRAGMQVGIGEGRPDSKSSNGMGWGLFTFDKDVTVKGVVE